MIPLPDWAPNVHPLVIHFPIALLVSAVLVDLASLFTRRWPGVQFAAIVLYAAGAAGALVAFLTGRAAADAIDLPTRAVATLDEHANLAEATLWFFGIYALIRLATLWSKPARSRLVFHVPLFLVGFGGLYLLYQTAEHGGELVYAHGIGVQLPPSVAGGASSEGQTVVAEQIHFAGDGSWHWTPAPGAEQVVAEQFRFLEGGIEALQLSIGAGAQGDSVLALQPARSPVMLVAGEAIEGIDATLRVDASRFDGTVMLVHHVRDAQNYDFTAVGDGKMWQGRVENGTTEVFDERTFETEGWVPLRAVSYGTHFRGYAGDRLVTHGHGDAPEAGRVGIRLDGTGIVLVDALQVTAVTE